MRACLAITILFCLLMLAPLVRAEALELTRLEPTPDFVGGEAVAWSPDTNYLAVGTGSSPWFMVYYVDGSNVIKLTNPVALPTGATNAMAWSSDGQYLAVASNTNPQFSIYRKSGTAESAILTRCPLPSGPTSQMFDVHWNGNEFVAVIGNGAVGDNFFVFQVVDCASSAISGGISDDPGSGVGSSVEWSPLGTQLAVGVDASSFEQLVLYAWDEGTETLTKYADPATMPASNRVHNVRFTDDGTLLAVTTTPSTDTQSLYVYTTSGGLTALTFADPLLNDNGAPSWNVDGALAVSKRGTDIYHIYERNGGTMDLITTFDCGAVSCSGGAGFYSDWTPDGDFVAFGTFSGDCVAVFFYDGSTLTEQEYPDPGWSTPCSGSQQIGHSMLFSPDGSYIATARDIFTTGIVDQPFLLTLTPLSSSEVLVRWPGQANAAYYKVYGSISSGFAINDATYTANTTQVASVFTGLPQNTQVCARARVYDSTHAIISTSPQACGSTTFAALTFYGNVSRVVPDNVTLYISRPSSGNFIVDCVRFDSGGAIQNACTADTWPTSDGDNNYTFRYPRSVLNSSTGDAGNYLVYVVNSTGAYLGGQLFCLQTSWSNCTEQPISTDLTTQLGTATLAEQAGIESEAEEAQNAATEKSVRGSYLTFLSIMFGRDIFGFAPNLMWWYFGALAVGIYGVMRRSRYS